MTSGAGQLPTPSVERVTGVLRGDAAGADVDPRLFGAFVEHMGRCVYTGIYEPGHPTADEQGFRGDVLQLARELGVTIVRYPGGNFVSAYDWEDGVGPREARPTRLDLAWRTIESNAFGTDEFVEWTRALGAEPLLAVNLGSRGLDAARRLVEYCNHPAGTALSDLRRAHGYDAPHAISTWCLGNEMDGPWQVGQKDAHDYGVLARETAKVMKLVDPSLALVACGSSSSAMPTFGSWESTVLQECYDEVDYVSLHAYYEQEGEDVDSFLASSVDMRRFIETVAATADDVGARRGSTRRLQLAFDEWNVWYLSRMNQAGRDWEPHPRLAEDAYTLTDGIVVGSMLITLLQHCDRVRIACLAQLVNALAPIRTEPGGPAWRQSTFFPFALTSRYAKGGRTIEVQLDAAEVETARFGAVSALDAAAVVQDESGEVAIFVLNRNRSRTCNAEVEIRGLSQLEVLEHLALTGRDPSASNTVEAPHAVAPVRIEGGLVDHDRLRVTLPAMSWNAIRLRPVAA